MLLFNLQDMFNTPYKFFYGFIMTPEGQAVLQASYKLYPNFMTNLEEYNKLNQYIMEALEKWVVNYLSDDELYTGYIWLENMNKALFLIIRHYMTTYSFMLKTK